MDYNVIAEEYTLPSKGLVYSQQVNPDVKLRSMTTQEEMKRLGHSDKPYKLLSEIIDDCLVEKPGISVYDLCLGDYLYLLYKLRIVTYGPEYKIETVCPICGAINKQVVDLESLEILECSDDYKNNLEITLPVTKKEVRLRLQTPRMLDDNAAKSKDMQKKSFDLKGEPAFLLNLESIIETIDGEIPNPAQLKMFVKNLPMRDANYILQSIGKIDIGINTTVEHKCPSCGHTYEQALPISREFFRPSID